MSTTNGAEVSQVHTKVLRDYDQATKLLGLSAEERDRWVVAEELRLELLEEAKQRHAQRQADAAGIRPLRERLYTPSQAMAAEPPAPLIKDTVDAGSLNMMTGTRGTGKTFVITDMALSIGTGRTWAGRPTTRGRVLFVVGEGGQRAYGIRVEAWLKHHGIPLGDLDSQMLMVDGAVPFLSAGWKDLVAFTAEWRPAFVVLDTLARHQIGLEENSNSDASVAIAKAASLQAHGAAVMIAHHPVKGGGGGVNAARGAGSWEGGLDTAFTLESTELGEDGPEQVRGLVRMTCTKQKHRPDGDVWDFRPVSVPVTPNGTWDSSVVMVQVDAITKGLAETTAKRTAESRVDAELLEFIRAAEPNTLGEVVKWASKHGHGRNAVTDSANRLEQTGRVIDVGKGMTRALRVVDPTTEPTAREAPVEP